MALPRVSQPLRHRVTPLLLRFGPARLTFVASQPAISNLPGGFAPAAAAAFAFAFGAADFPFPAAFPFPFPPAAFPFPSAFAFAVFPPAAAGFFDSADAVYSSSSSVFFFLISQLFRLPDLGFLLRGNCKFGL